MEDLAAKFIDAINAWIPFDLTERVKLEFDRQGISIPYPQTDVHQSAA